jgi:hypothetical protein
MLFSRAADLLELEQFWRLYLTDARGRYEKGRTLATRQSYLDALRGFTDFVMGGESVAHAAMRPVARLDIRLPIAARSGNRKS